jgi:hypothetical protein
MVGSIVILIVKICLVGSKRFPRNIMNDVEQVVWNQQVGFYYKWDSTESLYKISGIMSLVPDLANFVVSLVYFMWLLLVGTAFQVWLDLNEHVTSKLKKP